MSTISLEGSTPAEEEEDVMIKSKNSCRKHLSKYITLLQWLPQYSQLDAVSDLIAGITLALTMIPQSIAYAALAGLTAQYGLYSTFVGSFVYVLLGTIKEVSIGPTSLMALLTIQYTRDMPPEFVVLLAFLTGCIEFLMGLFNLGFLVDFISMPVTSGFTSATSVIIIVAQLQGLFGLKYKTNGIIDSIVKLFQHAGDIRAADTIVGLSSIGFLLVFRKLKDFTWCVPGSNEGSKRIVVRKTLWILSISRNFLIVVLTSLIAFAIGRTGEVPFSLSGKVEPGLPSIQMVPFSAQVGNQTYTFVDMCSHLGSGILVLPVVAVLANIAIAKSFASGKAVDATQEMLTLGICNILGSFVQSMPTCGAFTRSAVSSSSGVRTPLSCFYTGIITLLALSFLTPYFYYIPRATLAAVLISAVLFMIDWEILTPLWKSSKRDLMTTLSTFLVSLVFSVEMGLLFGIVLNMCYLLYIWARPSVEVTKCETVHGDEYLLLKPDVGLFYPAVDFLCNKVMGAATKQGHHVLPLVLDCQRFKGVDYTAVKAMESLINDFEKTNQRLLFLHVSPAMLRTIETLAKKKLFRYAESEKDISDNLFGENAELSRSATVPVLRRIDDAEWDYSDNHAIRKNSFKDDKASQERASVLTEYKAVVKELETTELTDLKKTLLNQ